jgi:hypothetical protein
MDLKPFVRLAVPRVGDRPDLPPDLAEFYTQYEGVGRKCDCDRSVRLHTLDEVVRVAWKDLGFVGDTPEGWEEFAALWIGKSMFGDEIVYVLAAPSCPPGSILTIGTNIGGPGGDGPYALESSLVLAASFAEWLAHLERWGWAESALGTNEEYEEVVQEEYREYYLALNPALHLREGE